MKLDLKRDDWECLLATIGEYGLAQISPARGRFLAKHGVYPTEGRCTAILDDLSRQYKRATGRKAPVDLLPYVRVSKPRFIPQTEEVNP